jgi:predicted enzyme related to lactoylglutathione lyase
MMFDDHHDPEVTQGGKIMNTIIYPVRDLAGAKAVYAAWLGTEPYVDQPYYVGFKAGDNEVGLDPNGFNQGLTGPVGYTDVADIEQALDQLVAAGATKRDDPHDVGGGMLIATVTDPDGNVIGVRQQP